MNSKEIEFSLAGLAGLMTEHGFRVVAGEEKGGMERMILRESVNPYVKRVFETRQITLTVALETPEKAVVVQEK